MNKRGFTLVEMIVVIVLIGVIAVVAIPAVLKIMNNQNEEKYETHLKLVKQALDLYTIRYKGSFDNSNATMYRINYEKVVDRSQKYKEQHKDQTFIDKGLLTEDDVECSGYIYLTKKKNNNYSYDYYLTCTDSKNNTYETNDKPMPACNGTTCVEISN